MTRRTDTGLRQAISVIEQMLLSDPAVDTVLVRSCKQLMHLLGASFGYIYRCEDADADTIPWEFVGSFHLVAGLLKELPNTCTSTKIPETLQPALMAGRFMHFDGDQGPSPLPHHHPQIDNCFCIPVGDARRIYAVFYLCNSVNGFRAKDEARLRPFIAAASCLLRSTKNKAGFQQAPQQPNQIKDNPDMLLGLLDTLFNSVVIINEDNLIALCNNAASAMLGAPRRDLIGAPLSRFLLKGMPKFDERLDLQPDNSRNADSETDDPSKQRKALWRGVPLITAEGQKILVDLRSFELAHGDEQLRGLVMNDISKSMQSASEYHATVQRFQALTTMLPVAILQLNREWQCVYANDTWCEYSQSTLSEAKDTGWLACVHSGDVDMVLNDLREQTALNGKYEGEFRLHTPLGKVLWLKASACALFSETGDITGVIITMSDITTRLNNEKRLQYIAERDQLTGLTNRAFFHDRLDMALKGVERFGSVALMFVDLDEFKHINDTMGHDAGDLLLREVANRFRDCLRQVDTIARIGGDEFTVILTNVKNSRAITAIADKLLAVLADPIFLGERPLYITCSIGIAVAEDTDADSKQLLKQADTALYKAKGAGRNQYRFYTSELDKTANLHVLLMQSLKEKQRHDFYVVYQPQVDASSGAIVGAEALTRWSRDDAEPIGPNVFIKMIEESGLINEFSDWLLNEVFSTVSEWSKNNCQPFRVSINMSAKQFRDKDLAFLLLKRCQIHGVDPRDIVFEVTETAVIDDPEVAINTMRKLRRMGFGIALDDFGTGYSSLAYLRKLPLQCVKIDQTFIKDILFNEEDAKIVGAILALARTLNLEVVAEGVDNSDVMQWLIDNDCPIQQGFYFHKPLSRSDFESLMQIKTEPGNVLPFDQHLS